MFICDWGSLLIVWIGDHRETPPRHEPTYDQICLGLTLCVSIVWHATDVAQSDPASLMVYPTRKMSPLWRAYQYRLSDPRDREWIVLCGMMTASGVMIVMIE